MRLRLDVIRMDGGTQPRSAFDLDAVDDYAEQMRSGIKFPPVTVYFDGSEYWLADGFHRCRAADVADLTEIEADVHQGTQQDAQWYSFSANKANGLRRTNEDKQRAVKAALAHPQSSGLSDNQIAKHVGVDHKTVAAHRESILGISQDKRTVTRNGTTYQQSTANIGRRASVAQPEERPVCSGMVAGSTPAAGSITRTAVPISHSVVKPEPERVDDSVELLRAVFTLAEHITSARDLVASVPDSNIKLLAQKARDAFEYVGFLYEGATKRERQLA